MPWRGRYDRGVLATLLGVLLSGLLTAARNQPSVLEPLAVALMERTPLAMANWLVEHLGFWARPLAMSGAVAIAMLAGGLLGLAVPRRSGGRREALLRGGLLAVGALGSCLWLVARGSSGAAVALLVVGWAAGWWLLDRLAWPPSARAVAPDAPRLTRRAALLHLANGGVVLASVAAFLALADSASLRLALSGGYPKRRFFPFEPPPARKAAFAALPEAIPAEVTPVNRFYVMTKNVTDPAIAPDAWALRLEAAGRHATLRYADLLALPRVDRYVTLRCVSNPLDGTLMSNGYFSGAPVRRILVGYAAAVRTATARWSPWTRCSPARGWSSMP
ncbi:MAG: hypothetical protein DCC58_10325 [Chloroflexi bacterium]|nr:MAG: hypothetical protein DCC58_10325 [Chloroflexota bacterium]